MVLAIVISTPYSSFVRVGPFFGHRTSGLDFTSCTRTKKAFFMRLNSCCFVACDRSDM